MRSYNLYKRGRALSIAIGTLLVFLVIMGGSGALSDAAAIGDVNITKIGHFGGSTNAVEVSGNYAYTSQGRDFVVLNISNKTAPVEVGRVETNGFIEDIALAGNYAYVADGSNGLVIVDVTNPAAPTLKGSYDTGYSYGVAVSGNYAYVTDALNGLVIFRIDIPPVDIKISGIPVIGNATSNILKVVYTNFKSGDPYNISITAPNGTRVYYDSGTLKGTYLEIIPINWTPSSIGNHTIEAWGRGMINSTPVYLYDSEVVSPVPGLVDIKVSGIPDIRHATSNILKVEYTNFKSGDPYNISITAPNGTRVYYDNGTLKGTYLEIIPINWTPSSIGNHTIEAWGRGMIDSTPVYLYDSEVVSPVPELGTIVLVVAGMLGLIGMRRRY